MWSVTTDLFRRVPIPAQLGMQPGAVPLAGDLFGGPSLQPLVASRADVECPLSLTVITSPAPPGSIASLI
jgi:hypothetical protein